MPLRSDLYEEVDWSNKLAKGFQTGSNLLISCEEAQEVHNNKANLTMILDAFELWTVSSG